MSKVIVEPTQAYRIAQRRDPAPLSALLVTTGLVVQLPTVTSALLLSLPLTKSVVVVLTSAMFW
jgi:hypothetical protein